MTLSWCLMFGMLIWGKDMRVVLHFPSVCSKIFGMDSLSHYALVKHRNVGPPQRHKLYDFSICSKQDFSGSRDFCMICIFLCTWGISKIRIESRFLTLIKWGLKLLNWENENWNEEMRTKTLLQPEMNTKMRAEWGQNIIMLLLIKFDLFQLAI